VSNDDRQLVKVDDVEDDVIEIVETHRIDDGAAPPAELPALPPELQEFDAQLTALAAEHHENFSRAHSLTIERVTLNRRIGELLITTFPEFDRSDPKARFPHGSATVALAAARLNVDESFLHRCVRFAQFFTAEQIANAVRPLPWRAVEAILPIKDEARRLQYFDDYQQGKFKNSDELRERVAQYRTRQQALKARKAKKKNTRKETVDARRRDRALDSATNTIRNVGATITNLGAERLHELGTALRNFHEICADVDRDAAEAVTKEIKTILRMMSPVKIHLKEVEKEAKKAVAAVEADVEEQE